LTVTVSRSLEHGDLYCEADPNRFLVRHDLPQTPKPTCSERQHRQWC
jgi:hypothetical protein